MRDPRRDGVIPCSYLVQSNSATLLLASAARFTVLVGMGAQVYVAMNAFAQPGAQASLGADSSPL